MPLILQIETATSSCSVALANDGAVLAAREINERNIHAEVITRYIESVFNLACKQYRELDAVAVSSGPGSYTGLRIGISTAKGLCFALDKPLIAVDTLTAMANGLIDSGSYTLNANTLLCPMIDARRMEVYTAMFKTDLTRLKPVSAEIIDENSFHDLMADHKILFFGDGAEKCKAVLENSPNAYFLSGFTNLASFLTPIAREKFKKNVFEDVAHFEPFYLKDFVAGRKKN